MLAVASTLCMVALFLASPFTPGRFVPSVSCLFRLRRGSVAASRRWAARLLVARAGCYSVCCVKAVGAHVQMFARRFVPGEQTAKHQFPPETNRRQIS